MDRRGARLRRALRARAGRGGLPRLEGAEEEGEVLPGAADPFLAVDLFFFFVCFVFFVLERERL